MNNAGVDNNTREMTKEQVDSYCGTDYLTTLSLLPTKGPFVLTALLFPLLNRDGARVINLSSVARSFSGALDLNDLNYENNFVGFSAYGRTKRENILFTQALKRRADAAGFNWFTTACLHPGVIGT